MAPGPILPKLAGKVGRTGDGAMMPACTYTWGGGCMWVHGQAKCLGWSMSDYINVVAEVLDTVVHVLLLEDAYICDCVAG